jgi:hypothetical protein
MTAEKKSKGKAADRPRATRAQSRQQQSAEVAPAEAPLQALKWHEDAAFHVTLDHATAPAGGTLWRTHAYHNETGGEIVREGVLDQEVTSWMRERAGVPAEAAVAAEPAAEPAEVVVAERTDRDVSSELHIDIATLEIEALPAALEAGGMASGKRMRMRMRFDLAGAEAYLACAESDAYVVQLLARDESSGQATVLAASQERLRPERLDYAVTLDFDLPPLGSYQLLANVVLVERGAAAAALGPALDIVP